LTKRRVVITGMGMITSLGLTVADTWEAILAGRSGISTIDAYDTNDFRVTISGAIKNFDSNRHFSEKEARRFDTFVRYGIAASVEAMESSGLVVNEHNAHRFGVAIGSGIGGLPSIENSRDQLRDKGPKKVSPYFIPGAIINIISGQASIQFGLKGPNIAAVTACATGSHNIALAARLIAYGDADVMLCGGAEMASSPLGMSGFAALRALSTRNNEPEKASRPWDKDRDGFVLSDGAGVLVLEELEHAKKRGAHILAELTGCSFSGDASHITLPDKEGEGAARAIQLALQDAGLNPEAIDYINAHATSTPAGDTLEILSIKKAFGEHAYNLAVSSTKSMTGHLLGAAGAIEAIFSILSIRDQVAPPTINLDNPDEGCDLDLVPHHPKTMKIDAALSNSFGFGGTNGSLIFEKYTH